MKQAIGVSLCVSRAIQEVMTALEKNPVPKPKRPPYPNYGKKKRITTESGAEHECSRLREEPAARPPGRSRAVQQDGALQSMPALAAMLESSPARVPYRSRPRLFMPRIR
jgi:hypothetical protein